MASGTVIVEITSEPEQTQDEFILCDGKRYARRYLKPGWEEIEKNKHILRLYCPYCNNIIEQYTVDYK